jgi:membrane protein
LLANSATRRSSRLQAYFTNITVSVFYVLNVLLVFAVITSIFLAIFKVLPDGKVHWRDSLLGACFTAFLFMLGKFAISQYLAYSSVTSVYGAAGSIIVILLWVYYGSIFLYFGAEFTQVEAMRYGH